MLYNSIYGCFRNEIFQLSKYPLKVKDEAVLVRYKICQILPALEIKP